MIQVSGINHIVLHVQDVARARKFYTELLGMTVYRENTDQVFMHCSLPDTFCHLNDDMESHRNHAVFI